MHSLRRALLFLSLTACAGFLAPPRAHGESPPEAETGPQARTAASLGGFTGNSRSLGVADGMIRFGLPSGGILLVNPRVTAWDDNEELAGLGVIYRHRLPDASRLTLHLRGEVRNTSNDDNFSSFASGLEHRAQWYTLRLRGYVSPHGANLVQQNVVEETAPTPGGGTVTTRRVFESYDIPLSGWEGELGLNIPIPKWAGDMRAFGGRHFRDGPAMDSEEGWLTRFEYRPREQFAFEVIAYFDNDLEHSEVFWGGRITIPFGPPDASASDAFWFEPLPITPRGTVVRSPLQENASMRTQRFQRPPAPPGDEDDDDAPLPLPPVVPVEPDDDDVPEDEEGEGGELDPDLG